MRSSYAVKLLLATNKFMAAPIHDREEVAVKTQGWNSTTNERLSPAPISEGVLAQVKLYLLVAIALAFATPMSMTAGPLIIDPRPPVNNYATDMVNVAVSGVIADVKFNVGNASTTRLRIWLRL